MNKQEQPPLKRSNVGLLHCNCCGLAIDVQAGEDCPRCGYPISPPKEKRFLTSAIRDLQRVATHGGANITVASLLRRYQARLYSLDQFNVAPAPASPPVVPPSKVAPAEQIAPAQSLALVEERPSEIIPALVSPYEASVSVPSIPYAEVVPPPPPAAPVAKPSEVAPPPPSVAPVGKSPEIAAPRPPVPPVVRPAGVAPARQPTAPVRQPAPAAPVRESPSIREVVFSWAAFFVDNAITIIGLLGAFLILLGTLSFIYSNAIAQSSNRLGSFLVVFGAHAIFGILGVIAYRFPSFHLIARIYLVIYALLLPLAGFTGYSLILGHLITLSVPILIVIAAAYATIVYGLLAVYQGSVPFGYLGAVALAVVDLAMAQVLGLGYQWWPSMLMILALPALVTIARSPSGSLGERVFAGRLVVLREPIRILMCILVGVCALGILLTASYSFMLDSFGGPVREIRFSMLSMTLLLLLWTSLYMWLTRRTKWVLVLAYLFLASVLAFCYAFGFGHVGYALALTGVAFVCHGLSRFAGRLLQPFDKLGLRLDILALLLVAAVPLISEPALLLRLLFQNFFNASSGLPSPTAWERVGELIAIGASLVLTLSVAFSRAGLQSTPGTRRNSWPWLLLLSDVLLNSEYSVVVLALHAPPLWWFLGLTLALMASTVVVRRRFGPYWANPLDLLAITEAIFTLILSLSQVDSLWSLLLLFAALPYGMLLYQRRQKMLILPLVSALLALLTLALIPRLQVILLLGIVLPLVAVAVRRFMPAMLATLPAAGSTHRPLIVGWEWPLLVIALLSGLIVSSFDVVSSVSTVHTWLKVPFPVAVELAIFSLVWYVSGALARIKWWLLPTIGFAIAALLLPSNPFWVLVGVTCVSAVLALGVSRFVGRDWASPLYIVTLLAAVMTGVAGHTQDHLLPATTWVLLGFAVLVYIMGVVEDWTPWLWITPVFATWSLIDSAVLLGDLLRPPTVVLICAAAGVAIGLLKLFAHRRNRFVRYVLPLYTTAFVAAVLTGVYGTLAGVNYPFPGAVPVALLVYAAVAYGVVLFEHRPWWLGLVAGFATWGILLATRTASYAVLGIEMTPASDVLAIGIALGVVGLLLSRVVKLPALNTVVSVSGYDLVKFSWGWPWYVTALVAAIVTGVFASLPMAAWALLGFAVLFYIIGVVEDQVSWLWLAPVLITWSRIDVLLGNDLYGLFTVTLVSVALGVGIGVFKRFVPAFSDSARGNRYALPFYVTALVSAVLTGIDGMIFGLNQPFAGAIPAVLLVYAAIAYAVLLFEHRPSGLGVVAGFAVWGTLLALQTASYTVLGIEMTPAYTVLVIGIVVAIVGLVLSRVVKLPTLNTVVSVAGYDLVKFSWGWPWYVTALVAAIVTGVFASLSVAAWALLIFAVLAYVIGAVEDFALCLWLAPVLATWSLVDSVLQPDFSRLPTVALACAVIGVALSSLKRFVPQFRDSALGNRLLRYSLPFYAVALVAALLTGIDGLLFGLNQPFYGVMLVPGTVPVALLLSAAVAYGVSLFERVPEALVVPVGLAAWAIGQTHLALWQLMGAYSLLCVLIFGSQFIWKVIPPATNWLSATLLHRIFGLGGQALVVLAIILQGSPFADSGPLAHVGAGALLVLAVLLLWYGRLQGTVVVQRWCAYSAGALLSLVVPWELLAFRQTNLDLLTLVPASYLVVIGPFLMREAGLPHHRRIGQVVSMLGAALLLLPTLWLSFSSGNDNVLYTLILLGESLVLLVLGLGLRVLVLILCGAGLIVVGALHALFLSTSSTPPLALAGLGVILLLVATGLTLARRRLQAAWSRWQ